MTLPRFSEPTTSIPAASAWYLADIAEGRGRQDLFTRQSPQRLRVLREHAIVESAISSNRIEGVEVDQSRVATVVFGTPSLRDRDEEEVQGYRMALSWIHESASKIPISEKTILELHRLCRGDIWDADRYKEKDGDIIETYPDGRSRVRFKTVSAKDTPAAMAEIFMQYQTSLDERKVHPIVLLAAFNLDFLCIHPFRDGNGRVSRLLLLLQTYQAGLEVGRYISLERLIELSKDRYYETLEQSSRGWHEGRHDPWPYINYLLFIFKTAYGEFEERVGTVRSAKGEKTGLIVKAIHQTIGPFRVMDIQRTCPTVGIDLIRRVLKQERAAGHVECIGRGSNAHWRKTDAWNWVIPN